MKFFILAALIAVSAQDVYAQTMGPHRGPMCPGPGPVYIKPTPACGATTFHGGVFKAGRFQIYYQST